MKKKILAVLCAALIICLGVVSAYAIQPPMPGTSEANVYLSAGNVSQSDYIALCDIIECMLKLGYFQFGDFVLVGRTSTTTRLYISTDSATVTYSDTSITLAGTSSSGVHLIYYDITAEGFDYYSSVTSNSSYIFPLTQTVCYLDSDGNFVRSSSYQYGTAHSDAVVARGADWVSFYNKVWNYDDNIESSYNQGVADGGAEQYREGYNDGYTDGSEDGYQTGYSEGLSTGYASGLAQGEALGLQQGRQEGYETGYDEGYADGDAEGYDRGYAGGLNVGRQEGYETGYADGLEDGYETGYADGLEAGGGSGGSEPVFDFTVGFVNASLNAVDVYLRLIWDGSNPDSLRFGDYSDPFSLPAGYVYYTVPASFTSSQIEAPSSINFAIPADIREKFPNLTFGYVEIQTNTPQIRTAMCYLYSSSYDFGYNEGFQDGANIIDGLGTIATAPVNGLLQALDFEVFGLNVSVVVVGILAVLLAFIAWKFIKKFIPV